MSEKLNRQISNQIVQNQILKTLPDKDFARLLPDLEKLDLEIGQVLYRAEEVIDYVYFPEHSMISIVSNTVKGQSTEVGVIGGEGMTGFDVVMGSDSTLNENMVQIPNGAYRIRAKAIKKEFDNCGAFHDSLLSFVRLFILQVSQTAVCNRLHTVEERLARWLLMSRDRSATDDLRLTQEFVAIMLGTNRATVTMSAIVLQNIGYIKYTRGHITITDREGLEDFTCDCYKIIKNQYKRLPA